MSLLLTAGETKTLKNNPDKTILELEDGTSAWYEVVIYGGRQATGIDAVQWARRAEELGSGEILLTSMDRDGTCAGYDLPITKKLSEELDVPIIASGGVGNPQHIYEGFSDRKSRCSPCSKYFPLQ